MSRYIHFTKLKHLIFLNGGSTCFGLQREAVSNSSPPPPITRLRKKKKPPITRDALQAYNNACTCALMERDHIDEREAQLTMHGIRFT
jgi:hypothetical protein